MQQKIEVSIDPGTEFHYSDAGYCIIQQLIEDVTGQEFHQTVNEIYFSR